MQGSPDCGFANDDPRRDGTRRSRSVKLDFSPEKKPANAA